MPVPPIQSRQNEHVKNLVKLRERKLRSRQGLFFIEGLRELQHACDAQHPLTALYFCSSYFSSAQHAVFIEKMQASQVSVYEMSPEAFSKAAFREHPDGLIAIAPIQKTALATLQLPQAPLVLILEGIEKPGNLGAMVRSADGAGVDAIIMVDCVLDLYNPNAIRASQGLLFSQSIIQCDSPQLSDWLHSQAIQVIATTPQAQQAHWEVNYQQASALLLGSESQGLSETWLQKVQQHIAIPMLGNADSLNVAAAAAICLYEARRQRTLTTKFSINGHL